MKRARKTENNPIIPLRIEIDEIDTALIDLLALRLDLSTKIGEVKNLRGLAIHDSSRENQILSRIEAREFEQSQTDAIKEIYREIFSQSRAIQNSDEPLEKAAE